MTSRVFVYGTLKPGQPRWPILAPFVERSDTDLVSTPGRLFDTGNGWPAAVFDSGVRDQVPGVVVAIRSDSRAEALAILDAVEGVAGGLFRRSSIDVEGEQCWAYQWPGPTAGFRRITRWPLAPES